MYTAKGLQAILTLEQPPKYLTVFLSLSGSKATCQLEPSYGWECVCPKGYEGDGRICYGNAADVSKVFIISKHRTYCTALILDLNQTAKSL